MSERARVDGTTRRGSPSQVEVRPRPAPVPAPVTAPTAMGTTVAGLLSLQNAAGNGAVTRMLQRDPAPPAADAGAAPAPQAEDSEVPPDLGPSRLPQLDELLDRWNTPEDEVIDLLGTMGPSDKRAVIERYRGRLVDTLNGGEMIRAVRNLEPPLGVALDWIDAAALITRSIDYSEIRELVTRAAQPDIDAIANNHYRDIFVKVCTNATMITALVDLGFPWATARAWAREEGTSTIDLARGLDRGARLDIPGLSDFLDAADNGAEAARGHLRNLADDALAALRGTTPVVADIINDSFGSRASEVIRVLNGEISSGEVEASTSEDLLAGDTTGPFTSMHFGGDHRFDCAYLRDRVNVSVGVEITAADDRAGQLLPAAKNIWMQRIQAAWGNRFQLTNGQRTIPLQFTISLDSGPNHVNAHSGHWAWPKLNAGNWFVPDHAQQPGQEEAVSQAPVHEFGHLIGNVDEYNRTAEHYVQVTGQAVTSAGTVPETDTAGVTRYTNSLSLMGSGTNIEPRHISNILGWVNGNLRSGEPAFSIVA